TAAVVCFPGIFYRSGAEQKIRKYFVENNFIDCIISLPAGLFFGASIAVYILILKKSKTDNNILFIDANSEWIPTQDRMTNSKKTKDLSATNIQNILDLYANRQDVEFRSRVVANNYIGEQGYNLSVSTYVE
ncbi:MAG TPA: type I restriction-modification system subunit M, partial [Ruminococcaceae bacterium]|nr:type I restriction-modification system subunit M [Oscillospiraceae bacterium]